MTPKMKTTLSIVKDMDANPDVDIKAICHSILGKAKQLKVTREQTQQLQWTIGDDLQPIIENSSRRPGVNNQTYGQFGQVSDFLVKNGLRYPVRYLARLAWTSRNFPEGKRIPDLKWSCHEEGDTPEMLAKCLALLKRKARENGEEFHLEDVTRDDIRWAYRQLQPVPEREKLKIDIGFTRTTEAIEEEIQEYEKHWRSLEESQIADDARIGLINAEKLRVYCIKLQSRCKTQRFGTV